MKTKLYTPSKEFVEDKHSIDYVSQSFKDKFYSADNFEEKPTPTFYTLKRNMSDTEIELEFKPGLCELGDILAFLENPPEESKNGDWNLFYTGSCVVRVYWLADRRRWFVNTWYRGGYRWDAGDRVFSPATALGNSASDPQTLESFDPSEFVTKKEFDEFKKRLVKGITWAK